MNLRASLRLAAVAFAGELLLVAVVSAQAAPANAWSMVPAATTSCFAQDGFYEKLDAAHAALQAEMDRQQKVNAAAREKFDAMDMGEKAQRMQAFMMKNPQAAMKMMQNEQAAGASTTAAVQQADASARRLQAELQRNQADFRAAGEAAVKPVQARQKQLIDAKTTKMGEAAVPMFTAAADHAQYVQLIGEENAAYERACAPYFGASGTFQKWLTSYRTEVAEKMVNTGDPGEAAMIMQMAALDLPGGGYKSIEPLKQAQNFLRTMRNVYDVRRNKAAPQIQLKK